MNGSELIGHTYARLTVVATTKRGRNNALRCRCVCGNEAIVIRDRLLSGRTKSCGCLRRAGNGACKRTHGLSVSPEHYIWSSMKERCGNPRNPAFHNYGGRGITMCERWRDSFAAFYTDMGPRPTPKHSLDRIDNDGHYEPANCRWTDRVTQANNTRVNRPITFNGRTQNLRQWARELNLDTGLLLWRIKKGWPLSRALSASKRMIRHRVTSAA